MGETKGLTLAAKLAKIGKEIGAVDKSGRNNEQKYNYIEYGVVAGRIRELFDKYGVIILPAVQDYSVDEITSKYGNKGYHYVLKMNFRIYNADDMDDFVETGWTGESADFGDKGINKAETSGTKYFLMRLFNISEKGEEEADEKSPEIGDTKPKVKRPSTRDISYAIDKLAQAKSLDELKDTYASFAYDIKVHRDVVAMKDEMKAKLVGQAEVVTASNGGEDGVE